MLRHSCVAELLPESEVSRGIAQSGLDFIRANKSRIRAAAKQTGVAAKMEKALRADLGLPPSHQAGADAELTYPPTYGRFSGRCVAVTSINPNPARWNRQVHCVESWSRIGLDVITVNTAEELDTMPLPPGVTGVVSDIQSTIYDRPTQLMTSLLRAGAATGLPSLLINSDIEIHGHYRHLEAALKNQDKLTIGVRYNHESGQSRQAATRERSGLDVFLLTPEMISRIPESPFAIGKPVWDYWLPHWARSSGYTFHWMTDPFYYHETHPLGWSQAEWQLGANVMLQTYNVRLVSDSAAFRLSLDDNV